MNERLSRSSSTGSPAAESASRRSATASADTRSGSPRSRRTTTPFAPSLPRSEPSVTSSFATLDRRIVPGRGGWITAAGSSTVKRVPLRARPRAHTAVVRIDDPGHDGEPRPAPALPRSRPPSARQKRSNRASAPAVGRPGPGRARRPARRRRRARPRLRPRARRCVDDRIAQQVGEHLAQLVRIGEHVGAGLGAQLEPAVGRGGARRRPCRARGSASTRRRTGSRCSSSRASASRSSTSTPMRADLLDPPHRLLDRGRFARRAHAVQLGVAADRGERRAASCEASRKRRSRYSDSCRLANASSSRSSIAFKAMPSRPTSVRWVAGLTRRESRHRR